jgi:ankyrin repeat protein/CRP-like cAMP-binding protein
MDGDGRGDAASVEARDRLPAAARPGGEAASVDDHDDSDFDRVSVVSGASEWSDSASVRSGYTGLSGVSNADHRYADAGAVVRREAREAATRERYDDGASVSDASSDLSTSDDEFATRRLLPGRIPQRKARDRSLAMRLGDAAVRSHAMAYDADAMRDEAGATFRRDGPPRRSDGGSREDDFFDIQTRADRGGSARPVVGVRDRVTLVEACATGDVRIAKHTLERLRRETDAKKTVFDVDALDDGRAALHAAVELGDARGFELARFLCEIAGADVEVKGALGIRPLHVAAYCGAARCVAYLLSRGARPNLADDDGAAALHWAASSGKSLCVSALLRADDVDPDVVNDKGALAEDLVDENDVATRDAFAVANEAFQPHALARDGRLATLRRALSEKFDVARVAEDAPRARRARRGLATSSIDSGRANPERRPARLARRAPIAVDATAPDGSGETMVHRAARNGHADVVRVLVCEFGADLDVRCARIGATATHVAAENGHVDVLRVVRAVSGFPRFWRRRAEARTESARTPLSKTTKNPNDPRVRACPSGSTPLHLAARNGHAAACAFLVEDMCCDVDARDDDGQTAAHVAASSGRLETLRLLRANDADLDARDRDGRTPLHVAASGAFADAGPVARAFFVDEEVDEDARARRLVARDGRGDAPAHLAFAAGAEVETALSLLPEDFFIRKTRAEVETANESLRKDSFRGCGGWTCLHFAARGGYLHLVDALTRLDDVDVAAKDDAGATALHVAAETGVVAVLESLLAAAAERYREPEATQSLRTKTNVSASGATSDGAEAKAARLSGAAALARTRTNAGKTALHVACRAGNAASARAVLALCPDALDERDDSGATALHFASARSDRGGGACASLLLRHGCVMTARTHSDGAEPLHVASARGASLVVKALVAEAERRGVLATTVNRRTKGGLTPAACAARAGDADVFRFLLAKGADPFVPDARGNTCAHHACCRRAAFGGYYGDSAEAAEVAGNRAEEEDARETGAEVETKKLRLKNAYATTATNETRRARNARDVFAATLRHATRRARADHTLRTMTSVDHRRDFRKGNVLDDFSLKKKTHASSVCAGLEQLRVVRAANGDGETPAHVAARSGWACLLRFLLDRGADVLAEDARGRDVLQAACERDRPATVALILAYVQEHGEDHGEIFDEHVSTLRQKTRVRVWSEGVTPAAVRWRALRRALPDVVSAARAGVAFDANRADVEDALELAWFARLGVLDLCGVLDEDATGFGGGDDVSRDVVTRDASNDPALTFTHNKSMDAFKRIDATLRAADEAFKRARRTRFANRRSRSTGDAPLHVAASEARAGAVRVLIRAGADPNLRDEGDAGDAPLHRLARASSVMRTGTANAREVIADAARVLLRRGADQRAKNAAWVTPLHQAVRVGDVGLVGTLLRFAEEAEMRGMFGPSQTMYVPTDADADETSNKAEDKAEEKTSDVSTLPTRRKKKGTAYELVNRASRSGATPLHSAAELGHFEIFEALLAYGAEFDARTIRGESVAHVAARLGRVAILEKLLECRETLFAPSDGASPIGTRDDGDFLVARDHTESFPIHWAAAGGHAACIAALIRAGSPVSIGGMWRGASPAHLAARADAAEALRALVAAGADVSAQDFWTLATPLHYAAEAGAREATRVLMESHARLDAADAAGVLPENAARDATLGKNIRAFRIMGAVGVRVSGVKAKHVFYEWRALAHDARSARARDAKGTWQLVFALFAENEGERLREEDENGPRNVDVAPYYWLWRQWETRRRRRRRALGVGPRDAACTRAVADALESNPATAGLRHAALAWLAEASTARGAPSAEEHEERLSFFSSYEESPLGETYAKNQLVWREGTETDGTMCVVLEGAFDVFMTHEDEHGCKRESAVASLKKGATFGETALRFDGRRPTTVRARRDSSRVLRVRRRDFERAWEMEREAVERETAETRARRAAARRRRRAARRVKRLETNAKRTPKNGGVSLETRNDAKRLPERARISSSDSDSSENESVRTTVDPSALTPFELETSRDYPTYPTRVSDVSDARRTETTRMSGNETDDASAKKIK